VCFADSHCRPASPARPDVRTDWIFFGACQTAAHAGRGTHAVVSACGDNCMGKILDQEEIDKPFHGAKDSSPAHKIRRRARTTTPERFTVTRRV
jgi:hypothetical protein